MWRISTNGNRSLRAGAPPPDSTIERLHGLHSVSSGTEALGSICVKARFLGALCCPSRCACLREKTEVTASTLPMFFCRPQKQQRTVCAVPAGTAKPHMQRRRTCSMQDERWLVGERDALLTHVRHLLRCDTMVM